MSYSEIDYLQSDATALAAAIRGGQLSPSDAVAHAFAAIDRVNPQLNAVILTMREAADEQLRQLPADAPLRGVPVLLKDDCPTYAGVPMSFGCRAARGYVPAQDHEIVRRYKAAGMVIVGKNQPAGVFRQHRHVAHAARRHAEPVGRRPQHRRVVRRGGRRRGRPNGAPGLWQ